MKPGTERGTEPGMDHLLTNDCHTQQRKTTRLTNRELHKENTVPAPRVPALFTGTMNPELKYSMSPSSSS